jgi:hypothetical protein
MGTIQFLKPEKIPTVKPDPHVFGPPGSGSISQRDPELDPELDPDPVVRGADTDPHQNVTDPQQSDLDVPRPSCG